jgi:hypothetical protein
MDPDARCGKERNDFIEALSTHSRNIAETPVLEFSSA